MDALHLEGVLVHQMMVYIQTNIQVLYICVKDQLIAYQVPITSKFSVMDNS